MTERLASRRRARRRIPLALASLSCAAIAAISAWPPTPRLVWNGSLSAPVGLYHVIPAASLARGDMVVAWPPPEARRLAAERHYLPGNVPLVKRIAAHRGDHVCGVGERLFVNGRPVAMRRVADARGRILPRWDGCETLGAGRYLLLMPAAPDSFDGRYFGAVDGAAILGKAVPLWLR